MLPGKEYPGAISRSRERPTYDFATVRAAVKMYLDDPTRDNAELVLKYAYDHVSTANYTDNKRAMLCEILKPFWDSVDKNIT